MKINIINLQKTIPLTHSLTLKIKKAVARAVSSEAVKRKGEITVCIFNDKGISKLNREYLGKKGATDTIAFDISEKRGELLGQIALSADTAVSNAKIFKTSPLHELLLYVVHATLHILGYDDKTSKQRDSMNKKTLKIISSVN